MIPKKKKWSKGKVKEKSNNQVFLDKISFEKIVRELFKLKFISFSLLTEKYHISLSLSRSLLKTLKELGLIREVSKVSNQIIYRKSDLI
mmetsp:Transcript_19935/g.40409  ORF Transcript_19935/g.40409 Transcript_19935/m.40409 type:complete len:89 (-) Transcript_19935:111-377(-)